MNLLNITQSQDLFLREYQKEVVSKIYHFFNLNLVSVLLYAPTGSGKTVIASRIIADYVAQGKRVLFLVHRGKLVRQTDSTLKRNFGIEASVIWADYGQPDYNNQVQIAMLQTIQNRTLPPNIDLVILDEAHTASYYKIWQRVLNEYSGNIWSLGNTQYIGLSASPWRSKQNQGYCQFFQAIVRAPYPKQLINLGHLCRARQFGYSNLIDESQLKVVDGEFTEESMRSVCTPALNKEILEKYLERDPNIIRKSIAFCASVDQAVDLSEKFNNAGIAAECIVGTTSESERELIFEKYAKGDIKLISSVGVLCEGFDEPSVTAVLVCRPVKSKALWVQMNGRGLRLFDGKEDCWFLDYCNNFNRLGLPTDPFSLSLCPDLKPTIPIPTKTCPQCNSVIAIYEKICPECGFVFESERKRASRKIHKFIEILSPEQLKQLRYLKTKAVNAFNKNKSPKNLEALFVEEFGYNPPEDWFDGLIFGDDFSGWEANVQHYWRYLIATTSDAGSDSSKNWMRQCIKREFKSAINKATNYWKSAVAGSNISDEEVERRVDERLQSVINYKTWWVILGLKSPPDVEYLDSTYKECRSRYEFQYCDKPKILSAYVELIGIAMQEGIDYHSQDKKTINRSLSVIRNAINSGSFDFVKSYVERIDPTAKQRIWAMLSDTEKRLYRIWQKEEINFKNKSSTNMYRYQSARADERSQVYSPTDRYKYTIAKPEGNSGPPRTIEGDQLSLLPTQPNETPTPKPILKAKVPPPPRPYGSNLHPSPTDTSNSQPSNAPFVKGDRVRYVGSNPSRRQQYAGVLTVNSLEYGKVCVTTSGGYLSTWLDYEEIKRV